MRAPSGMGTRPAARTGGCGVGSVGSVRWSRLVSAGRAATLGRPRAMTPAELAAAGAPPLTPAAFAVPAPYVARGQLPDSRPMPTGPAVGSPTQPPAGGSDNPMVAPPPRPLEPPTAGP